MIPANDEKRIKEALTETIAWCSRKADSGDPQNCLRSPKLMPRFFREIDEIKSDFIAWVEKHSQEWIDFICEQRRIELKRCDPAFDFGSVDLSSGRIVSINLPKTGCGASMCASNNYFDRYDLPPWDTWFHYDGKFVYGWVPPEFRYHAEEGFYCMPHKTVEWFGD